MGEDFKRERAKNFRHQQVVDHDREFNQRNLLNERREILEREYTCELETGDMPDEVIVAVRGEKIVVLAGNRDIGRVADDDGRSLEEVLRATGGLRRARVADRSDVTRTATITLENGDE